MNRKFKCNYKVKLIRSIVIQQGPFIIPIKKGKEIYVTKGEKQKLKEAGCIK